MFAVLNLYKPLGLTSHDVVNQLRRLYGLKKIGHLGTLDPLAEGVLPMCLGQATRLIEYFPSDKRYRAEITLGITTSTLDREGDIVQTTSAQGTTQAMVEQCLPQFVGDISQRVPMHSAVHVKGKKLYQYAHQGITIETPTKTVSIYELTLLEIQNLGSEHPVLVVDVHCGSGTYIRALARDIGETLGCGAHLSHLIRTQHGLFTEETALTLETLEKSPQPEAFLASPIPYLGLPILNLETEEDAQQLCHGMKIPLQGASVRLKGNQYCFAEYQNVPLAVVQVEGKRLKPLKVFTPGFNQD